MFFCGGTEECKICKGGTYLNPYDMSCSFDCPSGSYMTGTGVDSCLGYLVMSRDVACHEGCVLDCI